jgi:hypothetical protein
VPSITTTSLPDATVGDAYSATVTATGTNPIMFAVTTGALPAGLVLASATGVISGTVTIAGSSSFTVTATNSAGTDSKGYTIVTTVEAVNVLTATGFDVLPWGVGGVMTLFIGAGLLVLMRKYRRSHAV